MISRVSSGQSRVKSVECFDQVICRVLIANTNALLVSFLPFELIFVRSWINQTFVSSGTWGQMFLFSAVTLHSKALAKINYIWELELISLIFLPCPTQGKILNRYFYTFASYYTDLSVIIWACLSIFCFTCALSHCVFSIKE